MRRSLVSLGVVAVLLGSGGAVRADRAAVRARLAKEIDAAADASERVKAFVKQNLLGLCTDEVFVREVKTQNARQTSLSEIQALDKQWSEAEDELPIHKEKLNNDCAKHARKLAAELELVTELFVMDNQGANVGQNELTSDYWQGDEPKWQNAYKGGQGGVDVSARRFDKSANAEDQKISLPLLDEDGRAIGAVCIGLKVGKI